LHVGARIVAKILQPNQTSNPGTIMVSTTKNKICDVTMAVFRGCTVPCFTRSPRWGTGYERDLKQTKHNTTKNTKALFTDMRKAPTVVKKR